MYSQKPKFSKEPEKKRALSKMFPVSVAKLYGIIFYRTTLVDYFSKLSVSNIAVARTPQTFKMESFAKRR